MRARAQRPRDFKLMFKTALVPVEDSATLPICDRNLPDHLPQNLRMSDRHASASLGIAQSDNHSGINHPNPRFRQREFKQVELEFFVTSEGKSGLNIGCKTQKLVPSIGPPRKSNACASKTDSWPYPMIATTSSLIPMGWQAWKGSPNRTTMTSPATWSFPKRPQLPR